MIPQRSARALAAAVLLALAPRAIAATTGRAPAGEPRAATPEERRAEASGYVFGRIEIVPGDIFDPERPGEGRRLFRLANRLHRTTRPAAIRSLLLFRTGDRFSVAALAESERALRASRFLYDARIRTVRIADGRVDVLVATRDIWTLAGGVAYHRAGGTSRTRLSLTDENFLGTGKAFDVEHSTSVDRTSNVAQYRDPSLAGSHARLQLIYAKNSDGSAGLALLERPFYSLDARWAAGGSGSRDDFVDTLYQSAHPWDSFRVRHAFAQIYGGLSPGLVDGATERLRFGFVWDQSRFTPLGPGLLPGDRALAYPWASLEYVEDGYVVAQDLDRIARSEDLNLGRQAFVRLGWSAPLWGGDRSRLVAATGASDGWRPTPHQLVLASLSASTRTLRGRLDAGIVSGSLRWYARDLGEDALLLASVAGAAGLRLDPDGQLLLGGDSGLRGYPFRYRAGDRYWLASLEQRFFGHREYFHLARLGAAAFVDAGEAWYAAPPPGAPRAPRGTLTDVGAGLRIGSSRSSQGSLIHLDLAVPLAAGRSIRRVQWLVSTSDTF